MGDPIFCPHCGTKVEQPGRACPACHEPMPAPNTVIGFGDLPEDAPPGPREVPPPARGPESERGSASAETRRMGGQGFAPPASPEVAAAQAKPEAAPPVLSIPHAEPVAGASLGGATHPGFPSAPKAPSAQPAAQPAKDQEPPQPQPQVQPQPQPQVQPQPQPQVQPQPQPQVQPQVQAQPQVQPQPQPQPLPAREQPVVAPEPYPAAPPPYPASTEPHEGPPAAAFQPPPAAPAQPVAQPPFVYGQPPAAGEEPQPALPATEPEAPDLAPTDTRKGLVWRALTGGAMFLWALIFGLASAVLVMLHVSLFLKHGIGNMHGSVYLTFGLAAGAWLPASLLLASGMATLSGRGSPRVFAGLGAAAHVAWAATTLVGFAQAFILQKTAVYAVVAAGLSAFLTLILTAALLAGRQWVGKPPAGSRARAVPYPLWAGPSLVALGSLSLLRELVSLVRVGVQYADHPYLDDAAEEVYHATPLFWTAPVALLVSMLVVVSGLALLRRARWSVGLGGAAGVVWLLASVVTLLVLFLSKDLRELGGATFAMPHVVMFLAGGLAAWFALAGALRYGFRLPRYLREAPATGPDGKPLGLLDTLVGRAR